LTLTQANSLDEASQSVLEKYKLTLVEKKNLTLHGMNVLAMVADQINEQNGQKIRILTYFISYNGLIYTFHGLAELANFDEKVQFFNETMRNFTKLTDQSKINKKPERIRIKSATQNQTLQAFLQKNQVPDKRMNELAVLNGMALDATVSRGELLKVVSQ